MRIGKLAQELGVDPEAVLGLLHRAGHWRYRDPSQQLAADAEALVRKRARELVRPAPARPAVDPAPVRRLDGRPAPAPSADDQAALAEFLRTVQPIGRPPSSAPARTPSPRPPNASPDPARTPSASAPPSAPPAPPPPEDAAARQTAALLASLARAEAEISGWRARVEELEAERDRLLAQLGEADVQREALRMALLEAERAARGREASPPASAAAVPVGAESPSPPAEPRSAETLRTLLERRGLRGESELAAALEVIAGAPRLRELLDHLPIAEPERVLTWLEERFVLVGPDEDPPPGVLPLRVAPARSELPSSPVLRPLFTRLATVLLVNGVRRVFVAGGTPAGRRTLRDGLDDRIDLRFVERAPQPLPAHAVALRWGGTPLADEVAVDGLGVPELIHALIAAVGR